MRKKPVIDTAIKRLLEKIDQNDVNWANEKNSLTFMLQEGVLIDRAWAIKRIEDHIRQKKNAKILDYGCGSGILNILLLLKGYAEVHGVDVVPKFDSRILRNLGFDRASFSLINAGENLPFEDNTFDVVTSSLVLEHVEDIDFYYSEAARVLRPGGVCLFNFPQRLKPYDSHSRCWFIHYFPKSIRKILWDIFSRQGGDYLNRYLFLRTVSAHKSSARKYFRSVEDCTVKRIKKENFSNYKGNLKLRKLAGALMNLKYIGSFFAEIFAMSSSADLRLEK